METKISYLSISVVFFGLLLASNSCTSREDNELVASCMKGDLETAKRLLAHGANPNATDENSWSSLMWAASGGHAGLVNLLIENHADVNHVSKGGQTALIMGAAGQFNAEVLTALIKSSANINATNDFGQTALYGAVSSENLDAVKQLLAANADPNIKDRQGFTALSVAKAKTNVPLQQLLRAAGAI